MDYKPYYDLKNIYDAKVNWNNATTDEERKKQNEIANAARERLKNYGYADVADQVSAYGADATAARKVLESYAPEKVQTATKAPDSTTLSNSELITTNNNETRNKINQLWGTQTLDRESMQDKSDMLFRTQMNDRETMTNKYGKLEDTAYSNPFESDEAKAILAKYDLSALQGRDNAVASGGASNGGNIDSYAAANALRQQASLVNQGQMTVLDAHNNKINNVKGILEGLGVYLQNQDKGMQTTLNDLGVYQQNQDKGMQNTIGLQSNEGQRLFENDLAEKATMAEVTGYTPSEWVIKNDDVYNTYLNADGTFKKEMENVDIQALINSAKASGDTDTANKLAVVRAKKILSNYGEFGKYANEGDISYMKPVQTEAGRQYDKQDSTVRYTIDKESDTQKYTTDSTNQANLQITKDTNQTNKEINENQSKTSNLSRSDIETMLKNTTTPSQELIDAYNAVSGDATTYTVDNPPPITGKNVKDETPAGGSDDYAPYTNWDTAGIQLAEHSIVKPDDTTYDKQIKDSKVDQFGKKAIDSVYSAVANGTLDSDRDGKITNYELADFLIMHSNENDTDKKQLKKVFAYFGLNPSLLDSVEDVGKGQNLSGPDYKYGVKYTS